MSQAAFLAVMALMVGIESFKLYAVVAHLIYIYRMGPRYRRELDVLRSKFASSTSNATFEDICSALKSTGGDKIALLGFKEYPARAQAEKLIGSGRPALVVAGYLIKMVIQVYDFAVLGLLGGLLLIAAGLVTKPGPMSIEIGYLALASCAILSLTVLAIGIEATVNYARLSSYGLAHHNPRIFVSRERVDNTLAEAATLAGITAASIYIDTAILSFLSTSQAAGFNLPELVGLPGLFNAFYHSFMTFIFSTQITPSSVLEKIFVINVSLQGIFVLVVALTAFGSASPEGESK